MFKFCANVSFMFTEHPFLERYRFAKEAGFIAVESGFPFNIAEDDVVKSKNAAKIQQILVNTYTGDVTKGELGFAAIPGKENEFKKSLDQTIKLAERLGAAKIHIMAGVAPTVTEQHHDTFERNLTYAVKYLEEKQILGLIEPINNYSVPNYYLNSYERALDVVKKINSPHLKIMLDIFHLQHIAGNVTKNIERMIDYIGHVQIAQVPDRHEPDSSGELDFPYVLRTLWNLGYKDWIGLEYKPKGSTVEGLKWIQEYQNLLK